MRNSAIVHYNNMSIIPVTEKRFGTKRNFCTILLQRCTIPILRFFAHCSMMKIQHERLSPERTVIFMETPPSTFTVPVQIDAQLFHDFAFFDTFRRQRRWVSPLIFMAILCAFACVCFVMIGRAPQAGLLGGVLLTVGLGLPAAYFLSFALSVKAQIKKLDLIDPRPIYTITLAESGVTVETRAGEQATHHWATLYGAYRTDSCLYLYPVPQRAYLLPDAQIDGGIKALWALLEKNMRPDILHDFHKD